MNYIFLVTLLSSAAVIKVLSHNGEGMPHTKTTLLLESVIHKLKELSESNTVAHFSNGMDHHVQQTNAKWFKTLAGIVTFNKKTLEMYQFEIAPFHRNLVKHLETHKTEATGQMKVEIEELQALLRSLTEQLCGLEIHLHENYLEFSYVESIQKHADQIAQLQHEHVENINDYLIHVQSEMEKIRESFAHGRQEVYVFVVEVLGMWNNQIERNFEAMHAAFSSGQDVLKAVSTAKSTLKIAEHIESDGIAAMKDIVQLKMKRDLEELENIQKDILADLEHVFQTKEKLTKRPKAQNLSHEPTKKKEKHGDSKEKDVPNESKTVQTKGPSRRSSIHGK